MVPASARRQSKDARISSNGFLVLSRVSFAPCCWRCGPAPGSSTGCRRGACPCLYGTLQLRGVSRCLGWRLELHYHSSRTRGRQPAGQDGLARPRHAVKRPMRGCAWAAFKTCNSPARCPDLIDIPGEHLNELVLHLDCLLFLEPIKHDTLSLQTGRLPLYASSWQAALPVTALRISSSHASLRQALGGQKPSSLKIRNRNMQPVAAAAACLQRLRALPDNGLFVFAARSSVAASQCTSATLPAGEAALALLRVAASERPDAVLTGLSICPTAAPGYPHAMLASLAADAAPASWDLSGGCLHSQRLLPLTHSVSQHATMFFCRMSPGLGGEAVIIGGLGGLGRLSTIWLLQGTDAPPPMLLLSRAGRPSSDQDMAALCGAAALVSVARCDVATRSEAGACNARRMVILFHAGGVLADGLLGRQSLSMLREAFAAKVAGWEGAVSHLPRSPVEAALLFSSIAGLVGSSGQGSYAAANAALDAAARACSDLVRAACGLHVMLWNCFSSSLTKLLLRHGMDVPTLTLCVATHMRAGSALHKHSVGCLGRRWHGGRSPRSACTSGTSRPWRPLPS